jgi:dihydroxyacetone kinase-like predicted kinase
MRKYCLEFILNTYNASAEMIKNSLSEFGEGLRVAVCQDNSSGGEDLKISMNTEDPTVIFDLCAQFGRIKAIKIGEVH